LSLQLREYIAQRRYAKVIYTVALCVPARHSICLSQTGILTRITAIVEGPRVALCQLKSGQLLHSCTKNHIRALKYYINRSL